MDLVIGDRVRVTAGPYTGWLGEVVNLDEQRGRVRVMLRVFETLKIVELTPTEITRA